MTAAADHHRAGLLKSQLARHPACTEVGAIADPAVTAAAAAAELMHTGWQLHGNRTRRGRNRSSHGIHSHSRRGRAHRWSANALARVVKTPKLQFLDSGLLSALLGLRLAGLMTNRTAFGPALECYVYAELLRLASWSEDTYELFMFRDKESRQGIATKINWRWMS